MIDSDDTQEMYRLVRLLEGNAVRLMVEQSLVSELLAERERYVQQLLTLIRAVAEKRPTSRPPPMAPVERAAYEPDSEDGR